MQMARSALTESAGQRRQSRLAKLRPAKFGPESELAGQCRRFGHPDPRLCKNSNVNRAQMPFRFHLGIEVNARLTAQILRTAISLRRRPSAGCALCGRVQCGAAAFEPSLSYAKRICSLAKTLCTSRPHHVRTGGIGFTPDP
jgi:hypothetical protein